MPQAKIEVLGIWLRQAADELGTTAQVRDTIRRAANLAVEMAGDDDPEDPVLRILAHFASVFDERRES